MTLRERYRRLTLWNRVGFWGSVASLVALALPVGVGLVRAVLPSQEAVGPRPAPQPEGEPPHLRVERGPCLQGKAVECITVWNDGAPIGNAVVEQFAFLEMARSEAPEDWRCAPVYYFFEREHSGARTGLLTTLRSEKAHAAFPEAENSAAHLQRVKRELAELAVEAKLRVFLRINVVDSQGMSFVEYFAANPGQTWLLSPELPTRVDPSALPGDELTFEFHAQHIGRVTGSGLMEQWKNIPTCRRMAMGG